MVGDYNAIAKQWSTGGTANAMDRQLEDFIDQTCWNVITNPAASSGGNTTNSTINRAVVSGDIMRFNPTVEALDNLDNNDHNVIDVTLQTTPVKHKRPACTVYQWATTDWDNNARLLSATSVQ